MMMNAVRTWVATGGVGGDMPWHGTWLDWLDVAFIVLLVVGAIWYVASLFRDDT